MYKDSYKIADLIVDATSVDKVINECNQCNICVLECAFLEKYGDPKSIAALSRTDPGKGEAISFECSLCRLCSAVCPKNLDISSMFLDLRKAAVKNGRGNFKKHAGILNYEKKGTSKKYTLYSLPENCDTIFFPGCSLPGTRYDTTLKTFVWLKEKIKNIGIVLDCCGKPSHDLGRQDFFNKLFSKMKTFLLDNNIKNIITACPNCYKIFDTYGKEFQTQTIYEVMSTNGVEYGADLQGSIIVHDPCPARFEDNIHESVRSIIQASGLEIIDSEHSKHKTFCCGEGGLVGCMTPELAQTWTQKRVKESLNNKIVSYCAGCVNFLSKKSDSFHVLDLIFNPKKTIEGKAKISKAPFTYLNRLKLKKKLTRENAHITCERDF